MGKVFFTYKYNRGLSIIRLPIIQTSFLFEQLLSHGENCLTNHTIILVDFATLTMLFRNYPLLKDISLHTKY